METAVGIFPSREKCHDSVQTLLKNYVPTESIVLITRPRLETFCKQLCAWVAAFVGVALGMTCGAALATTRAAVADLRMLVLCFGAAASFGMAGATFGKIFGEYLAFEDNDSKPAAIDGGNSGEEARWTEALEAGQALLMVPTEIHEIAQVAHEILEPWDSSDPNSRSLPVRR